MEIKSSLLNDKDFKNVKKSLVKVSEIDHKENFRVRLIEYINDSSTDENDMFFYDMLEFVRFLHPNDDAIAYTTPDKLIYLNAPGSKIGEKLKQWDFVYDHECLHQLWETFGVEKRIEKEIGECDHNLLNIASDCVINDYLYYYRSKERPEDLITPEFIKEKFGVDYDRKKDTQFTLYKKLLPKQKEIEKDEETKKRLGKIEPKEVQKGDNNGGGTGEDSKKYSDDYKKGWSDGITDVLEKKVDPLTYKPKEEKNDYDKGYNDVMSKIKQGMEEGITLNKSNGGKKGNDGLEEIPWDTNDKKDKSDSGSSKEEKGKQEESEGSTEGESEEKKEKESEGGGEASSGHGDGHVDGEESDVDIAEIKKKAQDVIKKYQEKISGDFGEFINKCKQSVKLNPSGLSTGVQKGTVGWNKQMNSYINTYVKKKVFQKKRQYESTYSRVKRGSGFVKYGEPINPGTKLKESSLTINVAFYVDRSGSMGYSIDNVFKASYTISESLKKQFSKEKVVDEVSFKMYCFDTEMKEIPFGKKCSVGGGTMGFHQILKFIKDKTNDFLINVIITDAQFSIDKTEVKNFIKDINGMICFVTNQDNSTMKDLSKQYNTQLFYILANSSFELDK